MKKSINWILIVVLIALLVPSCDWLWRPIPCSASGPAIVYKTKKDYIDNVTVQLSKDKKTITARPGQEDALRQRPLELANGYLLKRMVGDTYLSLTIEEYANPEFDWDNQDLIQYVIDTDPYLEKYNCCRITGVDTAHINILILENKLGDCDDLK